MAQQAGGIPTINPAVSTYTTQFNKKWNTRVAYLKSQGVDTRKILPVMQQDWQRVQSGSQPWSDIEAGLAVHTALTGKPPVRIGKEHHSGFFGALKDTWSGFVGDVGSIGESMLPTNLGKTLGDQLSQAVNHPESMLKPLEDIGTGHIGKGLEEAAAAPGISLIPGVYTAATVANGNWQDFLDHPILHVLDVSAVASIAGKAAVIGTITADEADNLIRSSEAGTITGKAADTYKKLMSGSLTPAVKGSPREALAQGKALKAGFRAMGGRTEKPLAAGDIKAIEEDASLGGKVWRTSDTVKAVAEHLGLDKPVRDLASLKRVLGRQIEAVGGSTFADLTKILGTMSDEERAQVSFDAIHYNPAQMAEDVKAGKVTADHATAVEKLKAMSDEWAKQSQNLKGNVGVMVNGTMEYFPHGSPVKTASDRVIEAQKAVAEAQKKLEKYDVKRERYRRTQPKTAAELDKGHKARADAFAEKTKALKKAQDDFKQALAKNAPQRFGPMLQEKFVSQMIDKLKSDSHMSKPEVDAAIKKVIEHDVNPLIEQGVLKPEELQAMIDDVTSHWQDLASQGYDPVWLAHTPDKLTQHLEKKPGGTSIYSKNPFARLNKGSLSFAPAVQDASIGMTEMALEITRRKAVSEYFKGVSKYATSEKDLQKRYGANWKDHADKEYVKASELGKQYVGKTDFGEVSDAGELYIPKTMSKRINEILGKMDQVSGIVDKATGIYKFAVLTGPRHIAHVLFSNMMFMMLEEGPFPLGKARQAIEMVRNHQLPTELPHGFDWKTPEMSQEALARSRKPSELENQMVERQADEHAAHGIGKSLGRGLLDSWKARKIRPIDGLRNLEENMQDMYRAMSYIHEFEKGIKAGYSDNVAHDAAIQTVNKIYMNIDDMAPLEREAIRTIFPFYAFTKHTLRYLLNYAGDHPIRAAVLARIVAQEQSATSSGLPALFNPLLFLGGPDASGNSSVLDTRSTNPFRGLDGQNPFTLAGFMSALNPAIQAPFTAMGVSTQTATGELYPELQYDPRTGGLVAAHPDAASELLSSFIPEYDIYSAMVAKTEKWKNLKAANPDAYASAIGSALNLPFGINPITGFEKVNVAQKQATDAINMYKVAQGAEQRAMKSGDSTSLEKYNVVPFEGQLFPSERIAKLLTYLSKVAKGGSPGSVLPRSKTQALQLVNSLPTNG